MCATVYTIRVHFHVADRATFPRTIKLKRIKIITAASGCRLPKRPIYGNSSTTEIRFVSLNQCIVMFWFVFVSFIIGDVIYCLLHFIYIHIYMCVYTYQLLLRVFSSQILNIFNLKEFKNQHYYLYHIIIMNKTNGYRLSVSYPHIILI